MKSFSINSWFLFFLFFIESNFCDAWLIFPLSSTKITDWVHPVIAKQNIWNNLWDIHVHAGPADKLKCLYMAGEIKGWFISILLLNFFYGHIRNIQFLIRNQKICEDHWSLWLQTNDCGKTSGSLSSTYMLVSKAVWTGHVKQEKLQPPIIWTRYTISSDTTKGRLKRFVYTYNGSASYSLTLIREARFWKLRQQIERCSLKSLLNLARTSIIS